MGFISYVSPIQCTCIGLLRNPAPFNRENFCGGRVRAAGVRVTLVSFEGRRQINKARAAILKMFLEGCEAT